MPEKGSHRYAKSTCHTRLPERFPLDAHGERFFMRCHDCNIEWTEYPDAR